MNLEELISEIRAEGKVDYAGAADLSAAGDFIRGQGGDFIAAFPSAVSVGIVLQDAIVDLLPRRSEMAVRVSYRSHAYHIVNDRLNMVTSQIASRLQAAGHRAFPVSASERYDNDRICAVFSHKLAAHLAGLGWIGKSCLLVTPEYGPRVRWATVLTDAPGGAGAGRGCAPLKERCGTCTKCVDICPAHAFTGRSFRPDEPRERRYAAAACQDYFTSMEEAGEATCGLCLYVCPYGMKKRR